MHEANFTREIVEAILEKLKKRPLGRASSVKISVGEMLHLMPEGVRLHYDLLTRGTVLEGTELVFEETPVRVKCRNCGRQGGVEDHHLLMCTFCDSTQVMLQSGNEVTIEKIEWYPKKGSVLT